MSLWFLKQDYGGIEPQAKDLQSKHRPSIT